MNEPLWRGKGEYAGPGVSWIKGMYIDTEGEVEVWPAGSHPPVTREQVDKVMFQAFGSVVADLQVTYDCDLTEGDSFRMQDRLTDAVMALLSGGTTEEARDG